MMNRTLNNCYDNSIDEFDDISNVSYKKNLSNISDELAGFDRLRITALSNAAEISHLVNEVTIGPNSPNKKEIIDSQPVIEKDPDLKELIEDKLREDLRFTLIMKKYESKLQETSEKLMKHMFKEMHAKQCSLNEYWKKHSDDFVRRSLENKYKKIQMIKELQENDNLAILENARQNKQKYQMINKQTIENMNRLLEEQNKATARFAAVTDSYTKICIAYNEITDLLDTESLAKSLHDKYIPPLSIVKNNIGIIMDLCKSKPVSEDEVKQAEMLAINIDDIKKNIINELNDIKQQELNKLKEEELIKQKLDEQKLTDKIKADESPEIQEPIKLTQKRSRPIFYSVHNYKYFEDLKSFLDHYEGQYKELLEDSKYKKFRFDCQKAVNTPVNALSSVSGLQMKDKYEKLYKLLKGETVKVLDTYVTATQHPQGLAYCTALLAKKIVRQGDLLVSSNPDAAYPLASLTVALCAQFPTYGKLLEAYFHRYCPYLVPMLLPQKEGQTDKEFYMSRGYTYNDEGVVEKHDKFLKRMSGIFRLHCAIWVVKTPKFINTPNPHGMKYGWQWLASFINLKPEPDICATLVHDFFVVCGSEFMKYYNKQCLKIIKLISTDYLAILHNIDEGGPKTRLEVFLQNVLKTSVIAPPAGLAQLNSW